MTQLDSEAWLERAREAMSPREVDQARVLSALEKRLGLPAATPSSAPTRANSLETEVGRPSRFGLPKLHTPSALMRWALQTVVPLAGVAAIGALLVTRSPEAKTPAASTMSRKAQKPVAAAVTHTSLPEALDLAIAEVEVKKDSEAPKAEPPAPVPKEKKPRKTCRTPKGTERPCGNTRPSATAVASVDIEAPPAAAAPAPTSLNRELTALREAQQALRNGHAQRALDLLLAFEREVPGAGATGAMQEERTAAATMARCALAPNAEARSELHDGFLKRYPKSAYSARLRRSCQQKP